MDTLKKLNYLFDAKLKLKFIGVFIVITIGSFMELLGISVILPIISMATNPEAMYENRWCILISKLTGVTSFRSMLIIMLLGTIVIYVFKNIYLAWETYVINVYSKRTRQFFCTRLMCAYMKQPYKYFLNRNTAEILRSVNSDTVNLYAVVTNIMQILAQGSTAALIIVYLAVTNPVMTAMVTTMLGICALLVVFVIQRKMRKLGRQFQKTSAYIILYSKQAFEGIKEVKVMNKEKYFSDAYANVFDKATSIEKNANLLGALPKYLIEVVCIGGIMGYLAMAVMMGQDVTLLVPQLAVFAVGAFRLLPNVNNIYQNLSGVLYHKASIDLIYHDIREVEDVMLDISNELSVTDQRVCFAKQIELKDITFAYDNTDCNVLEHVGIIIYKGESVAFVGESGGGKSTLADIILGLLQPQQGGVYVDGINIEENIRGWHEKVGYIPQMIFLLDDSIKKNIAFGVEESEIDEARIWKVLKEAQLDEFVKGLEHGIDTEVGERGTRLSGGQRQRIGIARALYFDPDVIVFDEATSALDTETEQELMKAVDALHGTKTMIMIAHRLSTIENCDHVYNISGGKVEMIR